LKQQSRAAVDSRDFPANPILGMWPLSGGGANLDRASKIAVIGAVRKCVVGLGLIGIEKSG
jgi:hypothetical protein